MITHAKTKQKLKKIDRSKRKAKTNGAAAKHAIDTKGMPAKDAKAVEKAAESLPAPRQGTLPAEGMAAPHYKELGGLAEVLREKKDAAKFAGKERKRAHDDLVRAMKQRGIPHYVDRGLNIEIRIDVTERVKVKKFNHTKAKRSAMFGRRR